MQYDIDGDNLMSSIAKKTLLIRFEIAMSAMRKFNTLNSVYIINCLTLPSSTWLYEPYQIMKLNAITLQQINKNP